MDASNTYDWSVIRPKFDPTVKPFGFLPSLSGIKNYATGVLRRFGQQIQSDPNVKLPNAALRNPDAPQSFDLLSRRASSFANEALSPYSVAAARVNAVGESAQKGITGVSPISNPVENSQVSHGTVAGMLQQFGKGADYMKAPIFTPTISVEGRRLLKNAEDMKALYPNQVAPVAGAPGAPVSSDPGSPPPGSIEARQAERFAALGTGAIMPSQVMNRRMQNAVDVTRQAELNAPM